jgi:hypothetical protein
MAESKEDGEGKKAGTLLSIMLCFSLWPIAESSLVSRFFLVVLLRKTINGLKTHGSTHTRISLPLRWLTTLVGSEQQNCMPRSFINSYDYDPEKVNDSQQDYEDSEDLDAQSDRSSDSE